MFPSLSVSFSQLSVISSHCLARAPGRARTDDKSIRPECINELGLWVFVLSGRVHVPAGQQSACGRRAHRPPPRAPRSLPAPSPAVRKQPQGGTDTPRGVPAGRHPWALTLEFPVAALHRETVLCSIPPDHFMMKKMCSSRSWKTGPIGHASQSADPAYEVRWECKDVVTGPDIC